MLVLDPRLGQDLQVWPVHVREDGGGLATKDMQVDFLGELRRRYKVAHLPAIVGHSTHLARL